MKTNGIIFLMLLVVFGCQPAEEEMPEDLGALKTLHNETKKEIKALESKLDEITTKIEALDSTAFEKPRKLVTVSPVEKGSFERFVELQGGVKADETVYVSSETGGRLLKMSIKEGDFVNKGSLVAVIDLESLEKQQAEVEKSLELARQVYERQERLWNQNIGTELQYLQAKNQVEQLEKSIETLKFQKTKSNVYAPISGEVAMVNREQGEVVAPGEPIVTVLNTRKLKVSVDIPENLLAAVNRGDEVKVKIPAIDYENNLKISRIGSQVNPTNRTIPVEVDIYNSNGKIKPNLLATMAVKDMESKDVITISNSLLQQEVSGKYFVYVATKDGDDDIATKAYVKVGPSYEEKIVIESGLSEGDKIIVKGARQVNNNDAIKLDQPTENNSSIEAKK